MGDVLPAWYGRSERSAAYINVANGMIQQSDLLWYNQLSCWEGQNDEKHGGELLSWIDACTRIYDQPVPMYSSCTAPRELVACEPSCYHVKFPTLAVIFGYRVLLVKPGRPQG